MDSSAQSAGRGVRSSGEAGPLQVLQHDGAQIGVCLERRGLGADHAVLAAEGDLGAAVVEGKRGVRLLCRRGGAGAQQHKREQQKQQRAVQLAKNDSSGFSDKLLPELQNITL